MHKPQLRIAPTPSGYLHLGNVLNFMLVQRLAQDLGAEVTLRIDDLDASRARAEYVTFIFDVLRHLGISWQHGPQHDTEAAAHSQWTMIKDYWYTLERLAKAKLLYPCSCTRQELEALRREQPEYGTTACPCYKHTRPSTEQILETLGQAPATIQLAKPQAMSWRLHPELKRKVAFGLDEVWSWTDVPPVMLRKEGIPAYHVASVTDDARMGTTHIVRGRDLLESSATQVVLAKALGMHSYLTVNYMHHGLLDQHGTLGTDGTTLKLSKSAGANAKGTLSTGEELEALEHLVSTIMQENSEYVASILA